MKFFDSLILETEKLISLLPKKEFEPCKPWHDAQQAQVIMRRDTAYELEGVGFNLITTRSVNDEIVVIGDDIVIHEFINSIKDLSKIKLGIVPVSKHDDFASYVGISHNPITAIKEILARNIVQTDIISVNNDIKVLNAISIGASVDVWERYAQFKIKNSLSENIAFAKYADKFIGEHLTFTNKNGKSKSETIYQLVIANGGKSKGKLVSPLSNLHDGLFNLAYYTLSESHTNKHNLKLFNKSQHIYDEALKQQWLTDIKLSNEENQIKAMLDGKIVTLDKLNIQLIENGLKLYKSEN